MNAIKEQRFMDIKVVLPTRGLIYARTLKSLKENDINFKDIFIVDGLGIPDAQNTATQQAMDKYPDAVLFVEEDMEIPAGTLNKMQKVNAAVVCVDYAVDNGYSTITRKNGKILWCGLGCTLVRRSVLEAVGYPYFDISYSYKIESHNPYVIKKVDIPYKYGGLDVNFFLRVNELGYEIKQLEGVEATHLRCPTLNKGGYNTNDFRITELPKATKFSEYQ